MEVIHDVPHFSFLEYCLMDVLLDTRGDELSHLGRPGTNYMKCIDFIPIPATIYYYHNESTDYEIEDRLNFN